MTEDVSIRCWGPGADVYGSQWQDTWMPFAYAGIGLYTFGIPLLFYAILRWHHKALVLQTPRCQSRYGFLYGKYEDRAWYWELFEMFRKLIFTSVIVFLANGTATQIVIAMGEGSKAALSAFDYLIRTEPAEVAEAA